jgi:ubiquinone/menaquinone biosynthesis C-methylase UbiE
MSAGEPRTREQYKRAAIEQWTADPCGSTVVEDVPGTDSYFRRLLAVRSDYAPWMADVLDYEGASGLEVLDIGCGQGIDLARYALAGAHVTGVDLTPRHVALAQAHLAGIGLEAEVVEGDAEQLPFPDESFDRVSSNGVLHHTPDLPSALREARRVLRPSGRATVILYNRASLHYWINQVLLQGVVRGGLRREGSMGGVLSSGVEHTSIGARPLVRVYAPREVRRLMTSAGFSETRAVVRHFQPGDTFITSYMARLTPWLSAPKRMEALGRIAGWYVVGYGRNS